MFSYGCMTKIPTFDLFKKTTGLPWGKLGVAGLTQQNTQGPKSLDLEVHRLICFLHDKYAICATHGDFPDLKPKFRGF